MKSIPLGRGMFALIDDEDFQSVSKHKWWPSKGRNTWYAMTTIRRKMVRMHKFLMPGKRWCDHRDGDGLNNQRENLRRCSPTQNEGNSRMKGTNTSGIKGVSWDRDREKWHACICINYKTVHLGRFDDKEMAAQAYRQAAVMQFGEFANPHRI